MMVLRGIYRVGHTNGDTALYRAGDINGRPTGQWWTRSPKTSQDIARNKLAIPEMWPDNGAPGTESILNTNYRAIFNNYTPIYTGRAAPQDGFTYSGNPMHAPPGGVKYL